MLYFSSLIYSPNENCQYLDLINISRTLQNRDLFQSLTIFHLSIFFKIFL